MTSKQNPCLFAFSCAMLLSVALACRNQSTDKSFPGRIVDAPPASAQHPAPVNTASIIQEPVQPAKRRGPAVEGENGMLCRTVLLTTFAASAIDAVTGDRLCDAEITVADGTGRLLQPFPNSDEACGYQTVEGVDGILTVTATMAGYEPERQQVRMARGRCRYSAPGVRFRLRPEARKSNSSAPP